MQSLFSLLGRFCDWSLPTQQFKQASDHAGTQASMLTGQLVARPQESACRGSFAGSPVQPKQVLRVKLHRDNLRDRTTLPTRLVISGRMADVHAELERLAAMEAIA